MGDNPLIVEEIMEQEIAPHRRHIRIANEVICELVNWIPLIKIPNVILVNRLFWFFCNESFDRRRRILPYMILKIFNRLEDGGVEGPDLNQLLIRTPDGFSHYNQSNYMDRIPFPEIEPPKNFRIGDLFVWGAPDRRALEFFERSKTLFIDANLALDWRIAGWQYISIGRVANIFEDSKEWHISNVTATMKKEFFTMPALKNCSRLSIQAKSAHGFEPTIMIDWLHTQASDDLENSEAMNQKWIRVDFDSVEMNYFLLTELKKRFLSDEVPHNFTVRFARRHFATPLEFHLENLRTHEIMFSQTLCPAHYDVLRCQKSDEKKIALLNRNEPRKKKFIYFH